VKRPWRHTAAAALIGVHSVATTAAQSVWDWGTVKLNPEAHIVSREGVLNLVNKCDGPRPIVVVLHTQTPMIYLSSEGATGLSGSEYMRRYKTESTDELAREYGFPESGSTHVTTVTVPGKSTEQIKVVVRARQASDEESRRFRAKPTGLLGEIVVDYQETDDCLGSRRGWTILGTIVDESIRG
jgi:hypothetical protein